MQEIDTRHISTQALTTDVFSGGETEAAILRLDKIHPLVSGNKWFKLRYYLEDAKALGKKKLITFGGPWSNHILATAAACQLEGLACAAVIRGERPVHPSMVLMTADALGMELYFTDRQSFAAGHLPPFANQPDHYIVPAGGWGEKGAQGAATLLEHCDHLNRYTHICCAVGTGTMMAGLINASLPGQTILGIPVLKNNFSLEESVRQLIVQKETSYHFNHSYHFGGYAKHNGELIRFMNDWFRETGIPTDFVYTGKLCYAVTDLARKGYFPMGSRILIIHSGGLTGNASLKNGTLIF